tara:strand:+ start:16977 stop:18284 length:1308 start_codon:yes stop_codon:yes gene_type:complete
MSIKRYSWGRYPDFPQTPYTCSWRDGLGAVVASAAAQGTTLGYGNGRSYGDSCLAESDRVVQMAAINRFIEVDWQRGVVVAEAGITLGEILATSIPRGWFLSVTPGTQFVTLGGAVANDVHGKNHHNRGSFSTCVNRFGLLRAGEFLVCSLADNPHLFAATIGGLGLTGIIAWVEIQLRPVISSQIDTHTRRFDNLTEFFDLSRELDPQHEYSVAWVDCLASGQARGRGVYMGADHAVYGDLAVERPVNRRIPFTLPVSLVNSFSLRAFNSAYWHRHSAKISQRRTGYQSFFYPLDSVLYWNRIYGNKGFQQYQCVVPDAEAEPAMDELLKIIANARQGSFLAVLKRCGNTPSSGLLSFPMPGFSLALDFPHKAELGPLFSRLDAVVREARGRLYPAKDAHMSGDDFRTAYPAWEQLEALRDPLLMSRFWKRVSL